MSLAGSSTSQKDEFGAVIEQLRKVQAAIRALSRAIRDTKSRAWEWRDRRDELRGDGPSIREQMEEPRAQREELNAEVARLKRLRNEEVERARELQEKLQEIRGEFAELDDYVSLGELQKQFRELEWRQQTTSTSIDEEREILAEMSRLTLAIEAAAEVEERLGGARPEDLDQLWQEIQEARNRAQDYHEQMVALVEKAQQKHQKIIGFSEGLGPARAEAQEAHQQFVLCLQEVDEMRGRIEELRERERELRKQLDGIRARRRVEREKQERQAMDELSERARMKQKAGQKLSMDELRALFGQGGVD